jgi:hypothetical protein
LAVKEGSLKGLFGVMLNLMLVEPAFVDQLLPSLAGTFLHLLKEDAEAVHYSEETERLLGELAYLLMVAVKLNFTSSGQPQWAELVRAIQDHYALQFKQGMIAFSSHNPYAGKILATCLLYIFNMRHQGIDPQQLAFFFKSILLDFHLYKSQTEKTLVSEAMIQLLREKTSIGVDDNECANSFNLACNLLHASFAAGDLDEDSFPESDEDD